MLVIEDCKKGGAKFPPFYNSLFSMKSIIIHQIFRQKA